MRKTTTIRIDEETLEKAQQLGLNISKTCENALTLYITAITNANKQITKGNDENRVKGCEVRLIAGGVGFEPTTASLDLRVDWPGFQRFMGEKSKSEYGRWMVNYAKRYAHCLVKADLTEVRDLPKSVRPNVMKALSNLAKYLGVYSQFKELKAKYGIKWVGKSSDERIIDRLTQTEDLSVIIDWILTIKHEIPELNDFIDLIAITGMRLTETINAYNLIISLTKKDKISSYYNEERGSLEHFKFKDIFLRRNKKVFVSFVPKSLIERIAGDKPIKSRHVIGKKIQRRGFKSRLTDIRETHASFMTKYLKQPEIDFLHGRVSANVFMQNYFNPQLIPDLKDRAFKAIKEIQEKISIV